MKNRRSQTFILLICFLTGFFLQPLLAAGNAGAPTEPAGFSSLLNVIAGLVSSFVKIMNDLLEKFDSYVNSLKNLNQDTADTTAQIPADNDDLDTDSAKDEVDTDNSVSQDEAQLDDKVEVPEQEDVTDSGPCDTAISMENEKNSAAIQKHVIERVEDAIEQFNDNIPDTEAEIGLARSLKANKILSSLREDLRKAEVPIVDPETGELKTVSGMQVFKQVYGANYATFIAGINPAYNSTYGTLHRWTLLDQMIEVRPAGSNMSCSSLMDLEYLNEFFNDKRNLLLVSLIYRFMQKSIDNKSLCGYPDFFNAQAALVLNTAWNSHSLVWNSARDKVGYEKNRKLLLEYYKFWTARDTSKEYFKIFLKNAGIAGVDGFKNILKMVKALIGSYEDSLKDDQATAAADGIATESLNVAVEIPVRIVKNKDNKIQPTFVSSAEVDCPMIELSFDYEDLKKDWPLIKKPLSENWSTVKKTMSFGFAKVDDELLVLLPDNAEQSDFVLEEQLGNKYLVRRPVNIKLNLSLNKKFIYLTSASEKVDVTVKLKKVANKGGGFRQTIVYKKNHEVPVDYEMIKKIPIPFDSIK